MENIEDTIYDILHKYLRIGYSSYFYEGNTFTASGWQNDPIVDGESIREAAKEIIAYMEGRK